MRRRALAVERDCPRHASDRVTVVGNDAQQIGGCGLALAAQNAVYGAIAVGQQFARGEGRAVAADEDEGVRQAPLGGLGQIDDLRQIRQVVEGKCNDLRLPALHGAEVAPLRFDLQVEQAHLVAGLAHRLRHQLQAQRFQAQEDARVHQRAGVNRENSHR